MDKPIGTWTTTTSTPSVDIPKLLATILEFQEQQKRIDDDMRSKLKGLLDHANIYVWAIRFQIYYTELFDTIYGNKPISARVWEGIREYFEPLREK